MVRNRTPLRFVRDYELEEEMMSTTLRLFILEDDPLDAELMIATLEEAGYDCRWERVETRAAFLAGLDAPDYDLILADYNLPGFDGLTALQLFLERHLDMPFILVSGTIGEETAIESLKSGATDYVLKDRLSRLSPAVGRALREKGEQRQRRRAEEALMEQERYFRTLLHSLHEDILVIDRDYRITDMSSTVIVTTGLARE